MLESLFKRLTLFSKSFFTVLKVILRSKLTPVKLSSENEEIFILGNGPSFKTLSDTALKKLQTKTLLCVNNFPSTRYFESLKPNFFLVVSPGFWIEAEDYNVSLRKSIIENVIKKTSWPMTVILPYASKSNKTFIKAFSENQNINIHFINTTPIEGNQAFSIFLMNKRLGSPRPHNVLIPSILSAIQVGFKFIYLIGADHSWLKDLSVNQENQVLLNQKHFYDEESATARQMHKNHGKGNRKLHEVLEKFYFSFKSYHLLREFANQKNIKVINLTKDSFIDAFEKKNISEIL